jgi:hypothetical protein
MYYGGSMGLAQAGLYSSSALVNQYGLYNIYKGVDNTQIVDPATGKINPNATERKWTDNWNKDIFKPGVRQEYNLTASGGSDRTRAYMSLSYLDDAGYVANSGFKRLSARGKIDQTISKHINTGLSFAYTNTDQQVYNDSEGSNYSNLFFISQYMPAIYPIYLYDKETGERKCLNVGHTTGHAVELSLALSHGESVLYGMLFETKIAMAAGVCEKNYGKELLNIILAAIKTPPQTTPNFSDIEKLVTLARADKKNGDDGKIVLSVAKAMGEWTTLSLSETEYEKALKNAVKDI